MLVQECLHLILNIAGIVFYSHYHHHLHIAHTTSYQVYPSEYAYHDDSVTRSESISANCRSYPPGSFLGGLHPEHYIHCDGTQLKLADSNYGQEQYQPTDHYVWRSTSTELLLFIFPTRVSLTTITLHYYSDSVRGLPRLIFYAVPDDFDVWDVPETSYPHVDVASFPPVGGPAGHRNNTNVMININIKFNTKKVLMFKSSSAFHLAVSDAEFFECIQAGTVEYLYLQPIIIVHSCIIVATSKATATTTMASSSTQVYKLYLMLKLQQILLKH